MTASAKTGGTWSLTILLAMTIIAMSVSYAVSTHLAQDASQGLRQITLITGPNIPPAGLWAFDISYVDDQSQVYYLADASNASVDLIDTRSNRLIGQIGGFRGFAGSRETQGPGGVLVDDLGQLWASDGDSTVKLIDLSSRTIVATLHTGGTKRADEMAYDPQDQLLLPLLDALALHLYDLGERVEVANAIKLGYNFLIAAAIEAMGEAAALVEQCGADRAQFLRMLVESPLFQGAVYEGYGRMIGEQDYSDARFPVPMGLKDVELILQAADRVAVPLPYAEIVHEHLLVAKATGRLHEDWSVLAEYVMQHVVSNAVSVQRGRSSK